MSSFDLCNMDPFVAEVTPQAGSLEEAASTQEILIQQIENYLQRMKIAVCTDLEALAASSGSGAFLDLNDTPGSYAGAALLSVRVNAAETDLEFASYPVVQGANHSLLTNLAADDHAQYLLLAGRAGGQQAFGGTAASEELQLRGSTDANLGVLRMQSPVLFDAYTISGQPYAFSYAATETPPGAFIGGGLNMSGDITTASGTFIYESFRGAPIIRTAVAPAFAAYTLMQALPAMRAGAAAGLNPLGVVCMNAGPRVINEFAAAKTTANLNGINFSPVVQTELAGATMSTTNVTGYINAPKFSTVAGSTINFGTIRGLWCQTPTNALFAPGAGTETMTSYIGVDVQSLAFGGNVTKVALQSAILAATNALFLSNTGGAESEFGNGDVHFNDSTWVKYGNTLANPDVIVGWAQAESAMVWSTFFGLVNNPLYLQPTAANEWIFQQNQVAGGLDIGIGFNVAKVAFGTALPNPTTTNWFVRFEAPNNRQPAAAGFYSDVWWTAGGLIDINGLVMSEVNSFRIDPNVTVLNGGTVADQSTLYVAGMGFPGSGAAARLQSVRVIGRTRLDGIMTHNEATLAQLTANVLALALPITNSGRFVLLEDADALGPWSIQGIVNVQVGDCFYIVNTGANAFLLNHQDGAAAAADRIISPTGANLTLGTDEMAKLWYDPVATRWRILEHTGA